MTTVNLECKCGEVKGTATDITPSSGTRVVCCCSDCQAFAVHLERDGDTLDKSGGTEIFQVSQSQVTIQQGHDKLQSLRLTDTGLLRWYTSCCNTPVGNTINARLPFVGIIHTFMKVPKRGSVLGPVRAVVQTQYAKGTPDYPKHSRKFPIGITLRIVRKMVVWKSQGKHTPSVFFSDDGVPTAAPIVLTQNNNDT